MRDLIKLHLGCGSNILKGWINTDLVSVLMDALPDNGPLLSVDLRQRLPFEDRSVDLIYMEHVIEHLTLAEGHHCLDEALRILKPGGVIRIVTPNLKTLMNDYRLKKLDRWKWDGWLPETACQMVNEGLRNWGHLFVYDADELTTALHYVGFAVVTELPWGHSEHTDLQGIDSRPRDNKDVILEGMKG